METVEGHPSTSADGLHSGGCCHRSATISGAPNSYSSLQFDRHIALPLRSRRASLTASPLATQVPVGVTAATVAVIKTLRGRKRRKHESHAAAAAAAATSSAAGAQVTLTFEGVHCSIVGKTGAKKKVILDDVSGAAKPGRYSWRKTPCMSRQCAHHLHFLQHASHVSIAVPGCWPSWGRQGAGRQPCSMPWPGRSRQPRAWH